MATTTSTRTIAAPAADQVALWGGPRDGETLAVAGAQATIDLMREGYRWTQAHRTGADGATRRLWRYTR